MTNKSIHAFFSGEVQGVGFRFTVKSLADRYKIEGWVMNKSDGKVELVAEGLKSDVDVFLYELIKEFKRSIEDVKVEEKEYSDKHKGFQIRFN